MEATPVEAMVLGPILITIGIVIIVFHKRISERSEAWNNRVPDFLRRTVPPGIFFSIGTVLLGVILIVWGGVYVAHAVAR